MSRLVTFLETLLTMVWVRSSSSRYTCGNGHNDLTPSLCLSSSLSAHKQGTLFLHRSSATLHSSTNPLYFFFFLPAYMALFFFPSLRLSCEQYPMTVATLSRRARDFIQDAYNKSVDADQFWSLESRLHDFGFRGCTSVEQSIIGGTAHLVRGHAYAFLRAVIFGGKLKRLCHCIQLNSLLCTF